MDKDKNLQNFAFAEHVEIDLARIAGFGTETGTPALLGSWIGGASPAFLEFDRDTGLGTPVDSAVPLSSLQEEASVTHLRSATVASIHEPQQEAQESLESPMGGGGHTHRINGTRFPAH